MTISANAVWEPRVSEVTTMALREAGMLHLEHQPTTAQLAAARAALPYILQTLQTRGMLVRAMERYSQATVAGSATLVAPPDTLSIEIGATIRSLDGLDSPLELIPVEQYMALSDKSIEDMPIYYTSEQGTDGLWTMTLYPIPTSDWPTIIYPRARRLRDVDSDAVTLDVPRDHLHVVALLLGSHFARNANRRSVAKEMREEAEAEFEVVNGAQNGRGDMTFVVEDLIARGDL